MVGRRGEREHEDWTRRWEEQPAAEHLTAPLSPAATPPTPSGARAAPRRPPVRWPGVALVAVGVAVLLALLSQVVGATVAAVGDTVAPGPARPEDVVGALAGLATLGLLTWAAVALVVSALAALLPGGRRHTSAVARIVAPNIVRHLVAALVGAAVIGTATPAGAGTGPPGPAACADVGPVAVVAAARDAAPDKLSPAWHATSPTVTPGWLPTEPLARPAPREGADPAVVTSSRRRLSASVDGEVVVRRGDTLWSLTERHLGPGATAAQVDRDWRRWYAANRSVLRRGPDHLVPGMRLTPPSPFTADLLPATGTETSRTGGRGAWR
jgi:nucleoid-associated protein YgaU